MENIRVTIRDIAARTGFHFTTVARALRESPQIREDTRKRIQAVAMEMGYRPDPMLSSLMVYRTRKRVPRFQSTIAWINNWPQRAQMYAIPSFQAYYLGAKQRARQFGYEVEEFWLSEPGMTPENMHRILKARGVSAMLLAPQPKSHISTGLEYRDFAALSFGFSLDPAVLHVVTNHQTHSMRMLIRHVRELGYKRIGLYGRRDWDEKVENSLVAGLLAEQWKHPELCAIPPLFQELDQESREVTRQWLEEYRPDVVLSFDSFIGTLADLGYRVPQDIGFASFALTAQEKRLSGIYQNDLLIGEIAIDFMIGMLHRNERGIPKTPVRTLVESVWKPGETVIKIG